MPYFYILIILAYVITSYTLFYIFKFMSFFIKDIKGKSKLAALYESLDVGLLLFSIDMIFFNLQKILCFSYVIISIIVVLLTSIFAYNLSKYYRIQNILFEKFTTQVGIIFVVMVIVQMVLKIIYVIIKQ